MSPKNRCLWIICVSTLFKFCFSSDTITQNQTFKFGDVLVSSGNSFAFGFFRPGNSKNLYLGIWYHKVSEQTVIWVANRDNPIINGSTGIMSLDNSGNLVLHDHRKNIQLWSTNLPASSTSKTSHYVQLLETGNLILCQGDQISNIILWESFDYPTNTMIPHMKQGVNRTSGALWSLTSWKSQDDPGTGDFQHMMDLNGTPQFFLFKTSEKIWRGGRWDGIQLSGLPDMTADFIFTGIYVEDDEEVSLSFGILDPSIFIRVTVNESGNMERLTWQEGQKRWAKYWTNPREPCDYYSHCGSYGTCDPYILGDFECKCLPGYEPKVPKEWHLRYGGHGCERKPGEPTCRNTSAEPKFVRLTSVKVPDGSNAIVNRILGLRECEALCLQNCSCTAYSSANISHGKSGCITWYGELIDMRQFSNGGQDVYIKVSASEYAQYLKNLKGPNSKLLIILVTSIIGVLLLVLAIWLVLWKRKGNLRKLLNFSFHQVSPYGNNTPRTDELDENGDLPMYDLKAIISATNSFSSANKVGEGGFGAVYKGQLHNGRQVAIKRLSKCSVQGMEEFRNEVILIARLQHRNLVKLLGCCIQKEEKLLVYEYLPNKGLDYFIFDREKRALLDWQKRLDIILGIARGIVYLHRDSRLRIIHRDLKASNVLLDANMEPKISDFGMARIFNANQVEAKTLRVVGTYGYMPPEYAMQGLFSEKSDVFSYGVLLLEIISGRRNNSYFSENTVNLIGHVWKLWREGNTPDIVDPEMTESFDHGEVGRCILIGLLCVQEHAGDRPTMPKVLSMLCNQTSIPSDSPKQPAFVIRKVDSDKSNLPDLSCTNLRASVDNEMTITILQPR